MAAIVKSSVHITTLYPNKKDTAKEMSSVSSFYFLTTGLDIKTKGERWLLTNTSKLFPQTAMIYNRVECLGFCQEIHVDFRH